MIRRFSIAAAIACAPPSVAFAQFAIPQDAAISPQLTVSEALSRQIDKCWRSPGDLKDPERLQVRVRFQLQANGALASEPEVVSEVAAEDSDMKIASDRALQAVKVCAPFKLPAENYALWRDLELNFGLSSPPPMKSERDRR